MLNRYRALMVLAVLSTSPAIAQTNHPPSQGYGATSHPPQDQAIHERFYQSWMMPDNPVVSCCSLRDCAPAETYWLNGHWMARKVGDTGSFTPIPPQKVEQGRDTPDGRSHLCGSRGLPSGDFTVYCFIAGAGG
jgi:hypothetical protein